MAWRGASASTWLRVGWFPSTLVWFEQSWASKLAAKACMAAWLSEAVHREMRAAARDVCKSGGACRALAWASSLTNMDASSLHRPPVSIPTTTSRQRRLPMSSG